MKRKFKQVIVNNPTNIKTNNHLSSELIEHKKRTTNMTLEVEALDWYRHRNVAVFLSGLLVLSSPPSEPVIPNKLYLISNTHLRPYY
jgi:hypothetical protein